MIDPESGARLAGAGPRRDGYALAFCVRPAAATA
jgi:hypothetical protein